MQLTENQQDAVNCSLENLRMIITGGAGSGKTTVIKSVIAALLEVNPDENIKLVAPTGKAAARVTEATGYPATTIHSACGFFPSDNDDKLGESDRRPAIADATTVIVDEASMCDDQILAGLISRIKFDTRLILVGDPNQLPPVGAGYPFRDLIASGKVPHVHLDKVHRQAGELLENCYAILKGEVDSIVYDPGKGNRANAPWGVIECDDTAIQGTLTRIFSGNNCNEVLGIDPEQLLILTPLNKGNAGRVALNRVIQAAYHGSRGKVAPTYKSEAESDKFVAGDRVIWTKNDPELKLVNGDTGVVVAVIDDNVIVNFDGIGEKQVKAYSALRLAWVLTCHKAQGSQYRKVLVILASQHSNAYLEGIINRSWVYTAATRSKEATFFLGSPRAFRRHVNTPAVDRRNTLLSTMLA